MGSGRCVVGPEPRRRDERVLALFDFDGTITRGDSYLGFVRFAVGWRRLLRTLLPLAPALSTWWRSPDRLARAKEMVLESFFAGWERASFEELGGRYARDQLPGMVRAAAVERIHEHLRWGHQVAVVSGSLRAWLEPWCAGYGLDLIVTEVEIRHERLTGRFATPNCWGAEKARRVRAAYSLDEFDHVVAYGDSRGDREMLALADERNMRPFR